MQWTGYGTASMFQSLNRVTAKGTGPESMLLGPVLGGPVGHTHVLDQGLLLNCSDGLFTILFTARCVSHRATGLRAYVPQGPVCGVNVHIESGPVALCDLVALYLLQ